MKSLLHSLFALGLLCFILYEQNLSAFSFGNGFSRKTSQKENEAIYQALITGNKKGVSKDSIKTMQDFGLMHLLTPSGLHLGSFLLLFRFYPKIKFTVSLGLFLASFWIPGFLALKRMLIFYMINFFIKKPRYSFIGTLFIAILIGNYTQSPLSFGFSVLFWGLIIFHGGSKWKLVKDLFVLQACIGLLFHQEINLASILVNPIMTALFTLIFPFLLFAYPFDFLNELALYPINGFLTLLNILRLLSFLNVTAEVGILFWLIIRFKNKLLFFFLLFFFSSHLNPGKKHYRKTIDIHYPLPLAMELLDSRKRKMDFIDRTCRLTLHGDIYCRKKPSHLGGPQI